MEDIEKIDFFRNIYEEGKERGSFAITSDGILMPRTKNISIWGLANSHIIPRSFRANPRIVTRLKEGLATTTPAPLPAFFKFQKEPLCIFSEAVAMEVASRFSTLTSFNRPATIDTSEDSLYQSARRFEHTDLDNSGSVVFSFLGANEELVAFYKMRTLRDNDSSVDVMTICSNVSAFLHDIFPRMDESSLAQMSREIQEDYAYQYLLRDYLGDIDFTSKNAGVVVNRREKYAHVAPHFDFGEAFNELIVTKIKPLELDGPEKHDPETVKWLPAGYFDKVNASKIAKHNRPIRDLARQDTFFSDDKTNINFDFICNEFPEIASLFLSDLSAFRQSGAIPHIIYKYCGEGHMLGEDKGDMCVEYLTERASYYEEKIAERLQVKHPELLEKQGYSPQGQAIVEAFRQRLDDSQQLGSTAEEDETEQEETEGEEQTEGETTQPAQPAQKEPIAPSEEVFEQLEITNMPREEQPEDTAQGETSEEKPAETPEGDQQNLYEDADVKIYRPNIGIVKIYSPDNTTPTVQTETQEQ